MDVRYQNILQNAAAATQQVNYSPPQTANQAPQQPHQPILPGIIGVLRRNNEQAQDIATRLCGLKSRIFGAEPDQAKCSAPANHDTLCDSIGIELQRQQGLLHELSRLVQHLGQLG